MPYGKVDKTHKPFFGGLKNHYNHSVGSEPSTVRNGGSPTAASSRVGGCTSKFRASVTAEAKVREVDGLRHHDAAVMDLERLGRVQSNRQRASGFADTH